MVDWRVVWKDRRLGVLRVEWMAVGLVCWLVCLMAYLKVVMMGLLLSVVLIAHYGDEMVGLLIVSLVVVSVYVRVDVSDRI